MSYHTLIWVDDIRVVPMYLREKYDNVLICRTFRQAISYLNMVKNREIAGSVSISLDHDLGGSRTGYDLAKYIVENEIPIASFDCHSANVVGKQNITDLLNHYGYLRGI
jgi:hypothetical protein